MKTMILALALCGAAFAAKGTVDAAGQGVTIYMDDRATSAAPSIYAATVEASEMFAEIGVRLAWKAAKTAQEQGCGRTIVLTILPIAPKNLDPGVLALTALNDGSINVFYDRIQPMLANWPALVPTLLAHVFAHEIGHALQGLSRHSETGIMKALWTVADYHAMLVGHLGFTPLDAGLIRADTWRSCPLTASTD